jgi:hypothetical protein
MLPGQAYFFIATVAAGVKPFTLEPNSLEYFWRKNRPSTVTSSPRSRSGGSFRVTTLSR